jgi:serine protease Do
VRALTAPRSAYGTIAEMPMLSSDNFSFAFGGNKAMLGVNTEKADNGVRITDVTKESAAAKAGLQKDDVITKVGDKKIEDADDLYSAVGKYKPEDKVDVTYLRGGKENKVTATLGKNVTSTVWSEGLAPTISYDRVGGFGTTFLRRPRLGIQIQDTEDNSGVKVLDVTEETPAAKSGLKDGDIIYEINGKAVKSLDEIREETKDLKEGDTLKIKYKRGGGSESTEIKFPKRLNKASL